jgi:LysM repeat protein
MRGVTLLGLVFGFGISLAHGQDKQSYIRQYLDISISEMQRTGIPASIKLAQAILESNYGRSELAREAHNHFGIKCGRDWNGQGYGLKDDDRDQRGELVHSCFRVFANDEASFIAHSDFLADPAKAKRYGALFTLPPNDYKGWAQGLQKSGYATNQEYAKRLIQIIEEQELYRYDIANVDDAIAAHRRNTDEAASRYNQTIAAGTSGRSAFMIQFQNDIPYVIAQQGDDVKSIAKRTDVPAGRILRYNEITDGRRARLEAGDRVYLQPLKRKYHGNPETHVVTPGETIASIAHFYGVRSDVLRKRNLMSDDCEPAPGSRIVLRGKQKSQIRCTTEREYLVKTTPQVAPRSAPESHVSDKSTSSVAKDTTGMPIEAAAMQMPAFMTPQMTYTVQPKDTLYQIATRHGITVVELKKLNNLSADTIHPGQSLKIQN